MKPDFEKIAKEALKSFIIVDDGSPFGTTLSKNNPKWIENKIRKVSNELESAYLEGRKAQVKVDAEIAEGWKILCPTKSFHDDINEQVRCIVKVIESQKIK